MKPKPLWQITVQTAPEAEEAVAHLLERTFACSPSIYTDEQGAWVAIFSSKPVTEKKQIQQGLAFIAQCGLETSPATVTVRKLARKDWSEFWRKFFKPIEIRKVLLIKPSWSKKQPRKNQAAVILDPGLSFGTGQHPTTWFCLDQIVRSRKPGVEQALLDIGTGSGILAISAAKLGYHPVHAFDNDPEAVRIATRNARRNRVEKKWIIDCRDLTRLPLKTGQKYDVICANLVDDLLIRECKKIVNRLKKGGVLVLAGILARQFPSVQRIYEKTGLELADSLQEQEWKSAAFLRKKA